ncbi:MAG: four helix bundle protein [Candidatus Nomurabacteria bacterium]|nr:four helix bundle protein [Candidatus Nomurabacteria bacterium]
MEDNLSVIVKTEELYRAVSRVSEKLSGLKRQTIGRRLEDTSLELLEYEIMAKNAAKQNTTPYLLKACALTELVMFHLRILGDEKLVNQTTIQQLQAKLLQIGRELGGWRRYSQGR